MKKILLYLLMVALLAFAVTADPAGAGVTEGATDTYAGSTAGSVVAIGGNVTELDLDANRSTTKWAGFYGEVTGNLVLGDTAGNLMYSWAITTISGEVYASTVTPVWSTIAVGTPSSLDTVLGWSGESDDAVDTYNITNTALDVGATTISATATSAFNTGGGFENVLLFDSANYVFASIISEGAADFEAGTSDFEIMVPVTATAGTTYYFYAELD